MPNFIATALQDTFRIIKRRAIIETEIYVLGINREVKDAVAQTIAGAVTNRYRAISVIYILVARRHLLQYELAQSERQLPNGWIVWPQKFNQFFGRRKLHRNVTLLRSELRKQERVDICVLLVSLALS